MAQTDRTPVKEFDYLEQDPPIRNQNFVCLSFISPEDVLKNKEVYLLHQFLGSFGDSVKDMFSNLIAKYPADTDLLKNVMSNNKYIFDEVDLNEQFKFFKQTKGQAAEEQFYKDNNFQTTMRGIKVRGVYDTYDEAKARVVNLQAKGDKFNIFVASMGCWCPWSPNPDELKDHEYAETEVNTLMKMYHENIDKRDQFYQERKEELVKRARAQPEAASDALTNEDPWLQKKREELKSVAEGIPVIHEDGNNMKVEVISDVEKVEKVEKVETRYIEEKVDSIKI